MTKLLSLLVAVVFVALTVDISPASADECSTKIATACDTERVQAGKPDFLGKKATTPKDVVCLSVLASRPSALVLAEGRVKENEEVTGKVITSWRVQASAWIQTVNGYKREICIPASMLRSVVTLCNEENRSIWTSSDTAMLRRMKRIPANDPACLLGKAACGEIGL